jgi:DNA-binding transcriptional MerR regulator
VTLRTLRFYEDRGLIRPRRAGNSRFYNGLDRVRIQMILNGKRLGFTLTEIAELIGHPDPNHGADSDFETRLAPAQVVNQIDHLERQRTEIDSAIARLRATHEKLAQAEIR